MPATATFQTTTTQSSQGVFDVFVDWMARMVADSPRARAAERFGRLNKLSDAQLAELGLTRSELLTHCFGFNGHV